MQQVKTKSLHYMFYTDISKKTVYQVKFIITANLRNLLNVYFSEYTYIRILLLMYKQSTTVFTVLNKIRFSADSIVILAPGSLVSASF